MSGELFKTLLCGVGGQGVVTAAHVLGDAAVASGLNVSIGQLHGMSQRGGSVESAVVVGPTRTAFIGRGEADLLLGFEPMETLRAVSRVSERTRVVMNRDRITPFAMTLSGIEYPDLDWIIDRLRAATSQLEVIDATQLARQAGDVRALGAAMLGAAARMKAFPCDERALREAMEKNCPPRALAANRRAFTLGMELPKAVRA